MNLFFFFIVTLFLIICQTIVFPCFSWFSQCFDLLIINVLYLSLAYSRSGVVFGIIIIGGIMDSLSGVPFFLHIFSYLWIYLIVQLFKQVVFQRSAVFMMVVSLISVAIHQGLVLYFIFLSQGKAGVLSIDFTLLLRQMIWGVLFIPPGIWALNILRQNYFYVIRQFRRELSRRYRG